MTPSEQKRLTAVLDRVTSINARLLVVHWEPSVQVEVYGSTWTYEVVAEALDDVLASYQLTKRSLADAERMLGEIEVAMDALEKLSEGPKA